VILRTGKVLIASMACAGGVWIAGALAQESGLAGATPRVTPRSGVANLEARLRALSPDDPMAYFELGEEVAYEMPYAIGQDLARRLFVLAFELDRRREEPLGLGGSVCLALAEMSSDVNEQRWLRALAEALEGNMRDVRWGASMASGVSDRAPLDLADALGRLRAGDVRALRSFLGRFDAVTVLREAGMKPEDARTFVRDVERVMDRSRAAPASREVRKTVDGELVVQLDDASGGNPGPSLTENEYLQQLKAEMLLVDARAGTWAVQVLLDEGVPQRDIDASELAPYFDVDTSRPVFRLDEGGTWNEGRWVAPEQSPRPEDAKSEEGEPDVG
jgi:hypothetical protein